MLRHSFFLVINIPAILNYCMLQDKAEILFFFYPSFFIFFILLLNSYFVNIFNRISFNIFNKRRAKTHTSALVQRQQQTTSFGIRLLLKLSAFISLFWLVVYYDLEKLVVKNSLLLATTYCYCSLQKDLKAVKLLLQILQCILEKCIMHIRAIARLDADRENPASLSL